MIRREDITQLLKQTLEPLPYVFAMWEGGSAAFDRLDEYSDLDLLLVAADEAVAQTLTAVTEALQTLSPITHQYEVPQPTWHGHHQIFYRLRDTSEFLLIDCVVIKQSNPHKFLEPERHGHFPVYFDKANIVQATPWDVAAWHNRLQRRVADWQARWVLFANLATKECQRGRWIDAFAFYQGMQIRPLVELLRIKYDPERHDFGLRYLHHILPTAEVKRVEMLLFVGDTADLPDKIAQANQWIEALLAELWATFKEKDNE